MRRSAGWTGSGRGMAGGTTCGRRARCLPRVEGLFWLTRICRIPALNNVPLRGLFLLQGRLLPGTLEPPGRAGCALIRGAVTPDADTERLLRDAVEGSVAIKRRLLEPAVVEPVAAAAALIPDRLRAGGTLLAFGNGGSAADAQHLVGELVGRFLLDLRALPAMALVTSGPVLTAVANDFGYEHVF